MITPHQIGIDLTMRFLLHRDVGYSVKGRILSQLKLLLIIRDGLQYFAKSYKTYASGDLCKRSTNCIGKKNKWMNFFADDQASR